MTYTLSQWHSALSRFLLSDEMEEAVQLYDATEDAIWQLAGVLEGIVLEVEVRPLKLRGH